MSSVLCLRVLSIVSSAAPNLAKLKLFVIAVVDYLYYCFTGALLVACCSSFVCLVWFFFCCGFLVGEMSLSGIMQQQQQPILLCMLVVVLSLLLLCAHTESAMDWSSSSTSMVTELLSSSKEQYDEIESSSVTRRMLANSPFFISYGSLSADRIPCPAGSGRSYYTNNCAAATGPARPYTRGCSAITLCARG